MPVGPGQFARVTYIFSVGRFGWTESYFHAISSGTGLTGSRKVYIDMAKLRAALCGGGVILEEIRVSDVAVRRDADAIRTDYFVLSINNGPPDGFQGLTIPTAYGVRNGSKQRALIPNVAMNTRLEGGNKVYHAQHFLSGIPSGLVGNDELIILEKEWQDAFDTWREYLKANGFKFPALDREGSPNMDRRVTAIVGGVVTVPAFDWALNDRIRIINAVREGKRRGGSIVGNINVIAAGLDQVTLSGMPNDLTLRAGPKTIAHREETVYIDIANVEHVYNTHRNRGRPLFSPRGRRSRR